MNQHAVNGLKIMVVEDDKQSAYLMTVLLRKYTRELLAATTGAEAIEICRTNPDIDLIFMDIRLPVMDGYEATKNIRRFNPEVIIIAQTAFAMMGDMQKSLSAGCNDYITKPVSKTSVTGIINKYFNK